MRKRVSDSNYYIGANIRTARMRADLNVSADFRLFGSSRDAGTANSTLIEKLQRLPKYKADMVETSLNILLEAMDMDPDQRTGK